MSKSVSIAEARHDLAALVHELERKPLIELTRRGQPVAVLLSMREYQRLSAARQDFWEAYLAFRKRHNLEKLNIEPEFWKDVRDKAPGREVEF